MAFTKDLVQKLNEITSHISMAELRIRYQKMSASYRQTGTADLACFEDALAYAWARMPATASVLYKILQAIDTPIKSIIDLGAGTGAASFVSQCLWGNELLITAVEKNQYMLEVCRKIISPHHVINASIEEMPPIETADCVILSYVLGEVADFLSIFKKALVCSTNLVVVVMPGTPKGSHTIKMLRHFYIGSNSGSIQAPCTHSNNCPSNWCHFYARASRTRQHSFIKEGDCSFEDEPYSYLVISKNIIDYQLGAGRIISKPHVTKFSTSFDVCEKNGLKEEVILKKDPRYKRTRKLKLGDIWSI